MRLMLKHILLVVAIVSAGKFAIGAEQRSTCSMKPMRTSLVFPEQGVAWQAGEDPIVPCGEVPPSAWMRRSSQTVDLLIHADGPDGSGRYWQVTVGIAGKQEQKPTRGFCIMTSTVGWRTLQRFKKLPWIDDRDSDGRPELVLWDSFPLRDEASAAEYALVAWVYELDSKETLVIDWDLSRKFALEVARAYRAPMEPASQGLRALRNKAARELESFGRGTCTPSVEGAR